MYKYLRIQNYFKYEMVERPGLVRKQHDDDCHLYLKGSDRKRNQTSLVSLRGHKGADGAEMRRGTHVEKSFPADWHCLKMELFVSRVELSYKRAE